MRQRGTFKIANRGREIDTFLDPIVRSDRRVRLILDSLRSEILEGGGGANLRIRRVFQTPREIYRLELQLPALGYQRTTLLDRDALEELLEADEVRAVVRRSALGPTAIDAFRE
ncbi:MAG: hypothetical protein V3U03_16990 [Myxococcota bacterium]